MKIPFIKTAVFIGTMLGVAQVYATTYDPGDAEILNILWRVRNGQDLSAAIDKSGVEQMLNDGEIFYIPRYHYGGTVPFYQLLCGSRDHMVSRLDTETGCTKEYVVGYAFSDSSSAPGLSVIARGYNSSTRDHAIMGPDESLPGYSPEPLNVYGWPRYNKSIESFVTLSAGGVELQANRVAGCSIWRWTWNGKQFVNHHDDGREMQASLAWVDSTHNTPNPTEAGDRYRNGSPCISAAVTGATLDTNAVPLEWNGGSLRGAQGGPYNPVIWENLKIGKEVTLDYRGMGPVASYKTYVTLVRALAQGVVEIPTVYLNPDFDRTFTYDAGADKLSSAQVTFGHAVVFQPSSGYGGVIATTADHRFAMGIYGVMGSSSGSVSSFNAINFIRVGTGDSGGAANDTMKLSAKYEGPLTAGANTFTTWVMSGSLDDVVRFMSALYRSDR